MIEQKNPSVYDYDACRALWQRVSPSEDPYPVAEEVGTQSGELSLPGAEGDPCCMERRRRIPSRCCKAFCAKDWGDAQVYAYLAANLPRRETARLFRALSEEEKRHARDLAAAIYLITGKPYCPARMR